MRYPKNEFGIALGTFCDKYGLSVSFVAEAAGVKRSTMLAAGIGRTAGHELVPKVYAYMAEYEASRQK